MVSTQRLPQPSVDSYGWQLHAACRMVSSDVFFSPYLERGPFRRRREAEAKEICARCPVQAMCLIHALKVGEPYGVWGGLTTSERQQVLAS